MRNYRIVHGEPLVLPKLVEGTQDMLARPRPDTPIMCVAAPFERLFASYDHLGRPVAMVNVPAGHYHTVPQAGFQLSVHPEDVAGGDAEPNPAWTYQISGAGNQDNPGARELGIAWRNTSATSIVMQRIMPAKTVGKIALDAEPGWIETADGSRWLAIPDAWILWDATSRNVRVAPIMELGREFKELVGSGDPIKLV